MERGQLSPLSAGVSGGKGLERAKFEAMLRASKERMAMVGAKKPVELRKEIAVKVQMAKQREHCFYFPSSETHHPCSPTPRPLFEQTR